ncbi:hypothetical protein LguiB_028387 [Lonicera macranthoides]
MVNDGNKGKCVDNPFLKPGTSQQNFGSSQSQGAQRGEKGKNFMEMEGRGYSDFFRNTSEELFMKTLMEGSIGMPMQNMEMLGFKNLSQNFRADSEELFKSWLTNGEASICTLYPLYWILHLIYDLVSYYKNQGCNSTAIAHHRTRQTSQRMSTELATMSNQQHGSLLNRKRSNENLFQQNTPVADESLRDHTQHSTRNVAERGLQASNLYLAKAWFNSSQPMTRSRSSELRRRYTAMQNSQSSLGPTHIAPEPAVSNLKHEFTNPDGSIYDIPNQFNTFMSPSNSSSSTFNNPQVGPIDKVSSVVSMLKGTLERKKLNSHIEKEAVEDSSLGYYNAQEVIGNSIMNQGQGNHIYESQGTFQDLLTVQVKDHGVIQVVDGSVNIDLEGFMATTNVVQMNNNFSREPSQSESSAAAHVVSTGFDVCDGPSNSGQTLSICESSRKQVGNEKSSENGSKAKDIKERIYDRKEDSKQKGSLVRYGSVTSAGSVDKGDPTKKRRVERSRKMAEAKERTLTPSIPSDTQSILKRCENLEKEVRSLKLNLAFMNRKDSEQTTQIEELQKQNEELTDEKERLLEEIERIISETGKM